MKKFKDYEGVICKDRTELKLLATLAEAKGYRVCCFFYKKPKYKKRQERLAQILSQLNPKLKQWDIKNSERAQI